MGSSEGRRVGGTSTLPPADPSSPKGRVRIFSRRPPGGVWLCAACEKVHVRYGGGVIDVEPEVVRGWLDRPDEVCPFCGLVHVRNETAGLDIPPEAFRGLVEGAAALLAGEGGDGGESARCSEPFAAEPFAAVRH